MGPIEKNIAPVDPEVAALVEKEAQRQAEVIRLIPSENYQSAAVSAATGSVFANKYSEGYPYKWKQGERVDENGRYYCGQRYTNELELLTIDRCKQLFAAGMEDDYHANVQPLSGSPANLAVLNALCDVGDCIMGLSLDFGGHLTHGHKVSATSKYFRSVQYPLGKDNLLDFDLIRNMAREHKPKVLICGATAYPRLTDFARFGAIAKEVGAYLLADISHISGLVATGQHPHPLPHADVVTSTTHKVLRGPRGGVIVCKKALGPIIDRSLFPGLQGGPHMNAIAGIAVALKEALSPEYKEYAAQVAKNARRLAEQLLAKGFNLIGGGTDTHLILIDMKTSAESVRTPDGTVMADACEAAGMVLNKNAVPGDEKPWLPSGVRLGTPACTTLGFQEPEMDKLADWLERAAQNFDKPVELAAIKAEVKECMAGFPTPRIVC